MKSYISHKEVEAAQITGVIFEHGMWILDLDGEEERTVLTENEVARIKPEVGQYLVVYSDGYRSLSPADVFEAGYSPKKLVLVKGAKS